jgi:poly-gamma-glutamate synthesis protein (capsule biosynthesis protein)
VGSEICIRDSLVTANNHSCDRGKNGIIRTVQTLDALQIPHTGTFKDSIERNASYPLIIRKNGIKVALLNYTYGTNGIAVPAPTIVNLIDTLQMAKDLVRAHDSLPDKIIMMIHWGDEYQSQPNEYQQTIADFCFRHGTDILIGSHPHVIQRMERKFFPDSSGREVLLVYSLGNYISNQRDRYKDGGASITFSLTKENGHTEISRAGYELTWVWIPVVDGRKHYYIVPVRQAENSVIVTDSASLQKMKLFINDSRSLYDRWNVGVEAVDGD